MVEDRRAAARDAVETARRDSIVSLPPTAWREIQGRAATIGVTAELLGEGVASSSSSRQLPAAAERLTCATARGPGQGLVEYGLILALTTIFTVIILGLFGGTVADVLAAIGAAIDARGRQLTHARGQ